MNDDTPDDDGPVELDAKGLDEVLGEVEASDPPAVSELAQRVHIAAKMDLATHGDETYDPDRAAEAHPAFDANELEAACEELVDAEMFVREGDIYALPEADR